MDMVVNAFIAAIAKHGIAAKPGLNVYNIGSSTVNPIAYEDVLKFCCDHFTSFPLKDSKGKNIRVTGFEFFSSMDNLSSNISDEIAHGIGLINGCKNFRLYLKKQAGNEMQEESGAYG